jgi:triacylglycerol lipase
MKSKHIVFVHGLFGWGPDEMGGFPYWGEGLKVMRERLKQNGCIDIKVHEASCGPVSSFHDRACEVFAQIRGTPVDYGSKHCSDEQHRQSDKNYTESGFHSDWSEDTPVILIGHSAGAHTCLQIQQLLAENFWNCNSNPRWVEAVICISGVLNGSTLPYMLGCDKSSGKLTGPIGSFIGTGVQILGGLDRGVARDLFDWDLDQWIDKSKISGIKDLITELENSNFAKGTDNLAYDMSLQGCKKANDRFKKDYETYYLSVVTEQTSAIWLTNRQIPSLFMNPALVSSALFQSVVVDFDREEKPLDEWGSGDLTIEKWRENDGAVSSISQRYPFTGGDHTVGGEGIINRKNLEKGKWYYEKAESFTGKSFDHLDVVFGHLTDPSLGDAHKILYTKLCDLICKLP